MAGREDVHRDRTVDQADPVKDPDVSWVRCQSPTPSARTTAIPKRIGPWATTPSCNGIGSCSASPRPASTHQRPPGLLSVGSPSTTSAAWLHSVDVGTGRLVNPGHVERDPAPAPSAVSRTPR